MRLQLTRVTPIAEGVKEFEFRDPDGNLLPSFEPGAHLSLRMGPSLSRCYSLTSDPADRTSYRIAVLHHEGGQGSTFLHEHLKPGHGIETEEPINGFPLADADHFILIAGAIGITPILSHARQLARNSASFELHYAARTAARLAFESDLRELCAEHCHFYLSEAGQRLDLRALLAKTRSDTRVYICGPSGLLEAVRTIAAEQGWPREQIHFESFGAVWTSLDEPVHLELTLSGLSLDVPVGQTLLEAMEEAGVWVPFDCRRGECHMCMTQVVEGEPLHRDHCLTPEERNSSMTPCVSWARGGRLVLEI